MPGLANLCESLWYMFPKERYSYRNAGPESRASTRDNNCTGESNCSTNRCANGTSTNTSDKDDHSCMDYDDFSSVVDASDHDHNDSMEDDLFAATLRQSVSIDEGDAVDAVADETL